jgi:hypothetical protein
MRLSRLPAGPAGPVYSTVTDTDVLIRPPGDSPQFDSTVTSIV